MVLYLFILLFLFGDGVCGDASGSNSGSLTVDTSRDVQALVLLLVLIIMVLGTIVNSSCSTTHSWFEILSSETPSRSSS